MNGPEIKSNFPKSFQKLIDYSYGVMVANGFSNTEESKKAFPFEDMLNILLGTNPRTLFDFFDDNQVFVDVNYNVLNWSFSIYNKTQQVETEDVRLSTRMAMEEHAFLKAFDILEKNLNETT